VEPNNIDIVVTETLYTHLFRSLCPVTGQPDWATICIDYFGKKIPNHDLLLRITSYRNHPGFHEECIETLFWQLTETYTPQKLSVTGLFTRRGGIDINPQRSTHPIEGDFYRSFRQ
jgi:7-cyano-7-deazaguanine reductase